MKYIVILISIILVIIHSLKNIKEPLSFLKLLKKKMNTQNRQNTPQNTQQIPKEIYTITDYLTPVPKQAHYRYNPMEFTINTYQIESLVDENVLEDIKNIEY